MGRDTDHLVRRGVEAAESIAASLQRLAKEDEITVEFGPPLCPACGSYDPEVTTFERVATGKLSEFVIDAECHNCGNTIYGVVESYSMHQEQETAVEEIKERAGRNVNSRETERT
jgi:hypothetical protein